MRKIIGMFAICMVMMVTAFAYEPVLDKEHCTYSKKGWVEYKQINPARITVTAFGVTVSNNSFIPEKVGFYIKDEADVEVQAKRYYEELENWRNGERKYLAFTKEDMINYVPFVTEDNLQTLTFEEIKAKLYDFYRNIKDFGIDIRKKQAEADRLRNADR